jgi:hypothetical protein
MDKTITIRLTPERRNLLMRAKKHFKTTRNSDVIDFALRASLRDVSDYEKRLNSVIGCTKFANDENSVQKIRALRDGQ